MVELPDLGVPQWRVALGDWPTGHVRVPEGDDHRPGIVQETPVLVETHDPPITVDGHRSTSFPRIWVPN